MPYFLLYTSEAFDSMHRGKIHQICLIYCFSKDTVILVMMLIKTRKQWFNHPMAILISLTLLLDSCISINNIPRLDQIKVNITHAVYADNQVHLTKFSSSWLISTVKPEAESKMHWPRRDMSKTEFVRFKKDKAIKTLKANF